MSSCGVCIHLFCTADCRPVHIQWPADGLDGHRLETLVCDPGEYVTQEAIRDVGIPPPRIKIIIRLETGDIFKKRGFIVIGVRVIYVFGVWIIRKSWHTRPVDREAEKSHLP